MAQWGRWRRSPEGADVWCSPTVDSSRTDPRATLLAAKMLGARRVLNWDAGWPSTSLRRGQPAVVIDYIDFTCHQPQTFFEREGARSVNQIRLSAHR
ncbi:MAG: hypothetical protein R2856_36620 [Caldilineaceae bacterium]